MPYGRVGNRNKQVIVTQASDLAGVLDSTTSYFLDGIIDMGSQAITVPATGLTISGYTFDISGLTSSVDNYTMFVSDGGGSGNVLFDNLHIEVSGVSSQVYNIVSSNGFTAIEVEKVNYNNCTSLGTMDNYRQGLETGTGRFGGSPSLTLKGIWLGGFRITTSITRNMSDTTTEPLFKAGVGLVMNSRFLTDMNVDLGTLQPFLDFSPTNFANPSSLELVNVLLTRDGVINPADANITPNISEGDLVSAWSGNHGVHNTLVGGQSDVTVAVETGIPVFNTAVRLLGTQVATDLQHFDAPANGELRFLGTSQTDYSVSWDFLVDGSHGGEYRLELHRNRGGVHTVIYTQTHYIYSLQGSRDVAHFSGARHARILQGDIIYWKVANVINTYNCTVEAGSSWAIENR